jgi:hypothetical protein
MTGDPRSNEEQQPTVICAPLCGAAKAYGRFDKPWLHDPECLVRQAWDRQRAALREGDTDA